jgi:hypothetical protein
MSTLSLRIPDSLHNHVRELAERDDISINQFISTAVAEKLSALTTEEYLSARAAKGSAVKFRRAMSKVKKNAPSRKDLL